MNLKQLCFSVLSYLLISLYPTSSIYANTTDDEKVVAVYLYLHNPEQLQHYVSDLLKIKKANFNRVIFSFVKPTLLDYQTGNLATTGILGYFTDHDGKGAHAFNALKSAIKLSKSKNIQTFISVGGWNYSCNFTLAADCGPTPKATDQIPYDWFLDPTDQEEVTKAKTSYANLIKLANDLGIDGIDFDYEEYWHADKYAVAWGPGSSGEWSTDIAKKILNSGGPTYQNLMKYGLNSGASYVMPKTIDKIAAILHQVMDDPGAKYLKFSFSAPAEGARPITGFVTEDKYPEIYTKGGLWWKGNLKGLLYHLANKDEELMTRFESIGLMTYDLCGDNPEQCAPYINGPLDLAGQVNAYMKDYYNWLKVDKTSKPSLTVDNIGKVTFLPAKYHLKAKILFGFEVNQPVYPRNINGQLQLTNQLVNIILDQQKDSGGVVIWQMYSKPNLLVPDAATVQYTISQSCKEFLDHDDRYDCHANFPSAAK